MSENFYNVGFYIYSGVTINENKDEEAFSTAIYLNIEEVKKFINRLDAAFNKCPKNIKRKAIQESEIVEAIDYNKCEKMLDKFFKDGSDPRKEAEKILANICGQKY